MRKDFIFRMIPLPVTFSEAFYCPPGRIVIKSIYMALINHCWISKEQETL